MNMWFATLVILCGGISGFLVRAMVEREQQVLTHVGIEHLIPAEFSV